MNFNIKRWIKNLRQTTYDKKAQLNARFNQALVDKGMTRAVLTQVMTEAGVSFNLDDVDDLKFIISFVERMQVVQPTSKPKVVTDDGQAVVDNQREVSDLQAELRRLIADKGYNLTNASNALGKSDSYISNLITTEHVQKMRIVLHKLEELPQLDTSKDTREADELIAWIEKTIDTLPVSSYDLSQKMGYNPSYISQVITRKSLSGLQKISAYLKEHYTERQETEQVSETDMIVRDGKTYVKIPLERVTSKSVLVDGSKFLASFGGGFYSSRAVTGLSFQTVKPVPLDEASVLDTSNIVAFVENFTNDRGEKPAIYQYVVTDNSKSSDEQVTYIRDTLKAYGVKQVELSAFLGEPTSYVAQALQTKNTKHLNNIVKFIKSDISSPDPMVFRK